MSARRVPHCGTTRTVALLVCMAAAGCTQNRAPGKDKTGDLHEELLRQANDEYTLVSAEPSVKSDALPLDPNVKAKNIQLFAFKMSNPSVTAPPRFVAAFLSTKNHAAMGLRKGMNYILEVRKTDGTVGYVVVPDDDKADMYFLKYSPVSNDPNGAPPHAIRNAVGTSTSGTKVDVDYVVGGCVEGCTTGHCGFSQTDGAFTATDAPSWGVPLTAH